MAAVDGLTRQDIPKSAITVHRPTDGSTWDELSEVKSEIQDELDGNWGVASAR